MPLLKQSQVRLVNMASVGGRFAGPLGPYITSKIALEGFPDVFRRQMHQFGVKVSIIEPGGFKTPILDLEQIMKFATDTYNRSSPEVKAAYVTDYMDKVKEAFGALHKHGSNDINKVVDAYVKAITSSYPRDRYVVGIDAKFAVPLSLMPAWLTDRFIYWNDNRVFKAAGLSR